MKKPTIISLSVAGAFILLILGYIIALMSQYNTAKNLRLAYETKEKANSAVFDNMFKTIAQTSQIPGEKAKQIKEILSAYVQGRGGIGNKPRSNATPIGSFQVIKEIGEGYSPDITIKGDSVISYTITRSKIDPIISRSIWIDGLDPQNNNTLNRTIRMHGSPFVDKLGIPCSMGCVRFAPEDIVVVCNYLKLGDIIEIQR